MQVEKKKNENRQTVVRISYSKDAFMCQKKKKKIIIEKAKHRRRNGITKTEHENKIKRKARSKWILRKSLGWFFFLTV